MTDLWPTLARRANVELSPNQLAQLDRYLDLLLAANAKMNLTRITDRAAAEVQHVGDSLTLLPFLPPGQIRLADVGSGGGVPGIPLAIVRPDATVLLIESTKKKAAFLKQTIETLELKNASVSESARRRGRPKQQPREFRRGDRPRGGDDGMARRMVPAPGQSRRQDAGDEGPQSRRGAATRQKSHQARRRRRARRPPR